MISIQEGLSDYVLYYWFDKDGNPTYLTKNELISLKIELEKQFKTFRIKKFLKVFVPFIIYLIMLSLMIIFCKCNYKFGIDVLRILAVLTCTPLVIIAKEPLKDESLFLYRLNRFKYMYNEYFILKGNWRLIKGCPPGGKFGIYGPEKFFH